MRNPGRPFLNILAHRPQPMQQPVLRNPAASPVAAVGPGRVRAVAFLFLLGTASLAAPGCGGDGPQPVPSGPAKPFAGVSLTLRCPDAAFAAAIRPAAQSWATRTGATVALKAEQAAPGD